MKKQTIFDRLRKWDESEFDCADALPLDEPVQRIDPQIDPWTLIQAIRFRADEGISPYGAGRYTLFSFIRREHPT